MKKIIFIIWILSTAVVLGAAIVQTNRLERADLRADSLESVADTVRRLDLVALGDSVNALQLRITQVDLQADSIEQELRQRPVVRIPAGVRIDTLRVVDTIAAEPTSDTTEFYRLDVEQDPFRVFGGMTRTVPGPRGAFDVSVAMTRDVDVGVRVTCEDRPGTNAASVLLTADDPFTLTPRKPVEQSPDVCNRKPIRFSVVPEISIRGIGFELLKIAAGVIIWEKFLDKESSSGSSCRGNCYDEY